MCSEKQYDKKLRRWNQLKNAKQEHKERMIGIRQNRAKEGKNTRFTFNKKPFSDAKLNRHIKDKKLNEAYLESLKHFSGGNSLLLMLSQVFMVN
jgi:hypothetical protein